MNVANSPKPADLEDGYRLYLDALRETSVADMYAAAPYLGADLEVARREAADALEHWMRTSGDRRP